MPFPRSDKVPGWPGWRHDRLGGVGCYIRDTGAAIEKRGEKWWAYSVAGRLRQNKFAGTRKTRKGAFRLALAENP